MTTLTLQPDATAGIDASIISAPDTNTGGDPDFDIGYYTGGSSTRRGLIKFDLSSIPAAATIASAVLSLWVRTTASTFSSNNRTVRVYRIRAGRDWVENQVGWANYKTANAWTTAGCGSTVSDREATQIGSFVTSTAWAVGQQVDITLTPGAGGVQDWVSGALANNGMILISDTEATDLIRYCSSDHATANQRPKLVVEYSTIYTQAVAGTLTTAGTPIKATAKALAGAMTSSGALAKATAKALDGTLTTAGTVTKSVAKILSGVLETSGGVLKSIAKALAGTLASIGALASPRSYKTEVTVSDAAVNTVTISDASQ